MMTQRYAHLREDHLKEAIEKIDIQLDNLLYNSNFVDGMSTKVTDSTNLAQKQFSKKDLLPELV